MTLVFIQETAEKAGKTEAEVQQYYTEAKKQAEAEIGKKSGDRFWHRVHALTKQKAGLSD